MRLPAIVIVLLGLSAPAAAFDRAAWIADFEQLKTAITQQSPNLEWQAARGLDLAAVEARARQRLATAEDDFTARAALDRFVANFGDGHMELHWPLPPDSAVASAVQAKPSAPMPALICAGLGFRDDPDGGAVAERLPGYIPLGQVQGTVRAGLLRVGGRMIGVLRVPQFGPDAADCAAALAEHRGSAVAPCDDACGKAVAARADARFVETLSQRIRTIAAARPAVMLIDVAQNGGGNDSAIVLARMLAGADVPAPRMALMRSPRQAADLDDDAAEVRSFLPAASPADSAVLSGALATLAALRREMDAPCDRSPLWRGAAIDCSALTKARLPAGGLVAGELPAAQRSAPWAEYVSATSVYSYTAGLWNGPLLVLVDGNSASSAELFAAMLQDAGKALVIGSPTFGAGCGWTMPPEDIVLKHSGGRVLLPDCTRFRTDGRNEIDGVEPDVLIGFRRFDSPLQRRDRLAARLPGAIDAALAGASGNRVR